MSYNFNHEKILLKFTDTLLLIYFTISLQVKYVQICAHVHLSSARKCFFGNVTDTVPSTGYIRYYVDLNTLLSRIVVTKTSLAWIGQSQRCQFVRHRNKIYSTQNFSLFGKKSHLKRQKYAHVYVNPAMNMWLFEELGTLTICHEKAPPRLNVMFLSVNYVMLIAIH